MANRIRFHLDEHVAEAVAQGLKRRGIDATTTVEVGLCGADDRMQLEYAASEGRVFVTHDTDFLRLHSEGMYHCGIAYCHQGTRSIGQMIVSLTLIGELLDPWEMESRVEYL